VRTDGPASYFAEGAYLKGPVRRWRGVPAAASAAQHVAIALKNAVDASGMTVTSVCATSGVGRSTFYAVLRGDVYPDFVTVAELSDALGVSLWPGSPLVVAAAGSGP